MGSVPGNVVGNHCVQHGGAGLRRGARGRGGLGRGLHQGRSGEGVWVWQQDRISCPPREPCITEEHGEEVRVRAQGVLPEK